jgi:hypothetical protein
VAPTFIGAFPDMNSLQMVDTTGMKQMCWAWAYNGTIGYPVLHVLDQDSGTFVPVSLQT